MTTRFWWSICFALTVIAFFVFVPAIPQDQTFHAFADTRTILGIPNFWNVVSNLLFGIVGVFGLRRFPGIADRVLFLGVLLTAFGSSYYHWAPADARLVWDRLPMTVIFMAFVACAATASGSGERGYREVSPWLLSVLVALGTSSVLWWSATGDLRPYAVVKFGPILYLLPSLFSSKQRKYLWSVIGLFGVAQVLELADVRIYSGFMLSGHTLKHLVAGLATVVIYRWRLQFAADSRRDPRRAFESIAGAA
jgi:hypothetical protein